MPPTAEESRTLQDNLNDVEDLEGEESDEYDVDVGINCFAFSFYHTLPHRMKRVTKNTMTRVTRAGKVSRTV